MASQTQLPSSRIDHPSNAAGQAEAGAELKGLVHLVLDEAIWLVGWFTGWVEREHVTLW